jgi:hypothetical protein
MTTTTDQPVHRPGVISAFFVYKAGLFAAGFWAWLVHLAVFGKPVTCTLVAVVLGTRMALQRNAALRHQEIMKTLVEISWDSFTPPGTFEPRTVAEANGHSGHENGSESRDGDAGVIRLSPELRQRPRR